MSERQVCASLAVLGLLLSSAQSLHAQSLTVDVKLTFHQEKRDDANSSIIRKAPYPTQNLLTDLANAYVMAFPAGAKLVLIDFNHFQVQDAEGNVLVADTSQYLRFSYSPYLSADKYDPLTAAGKSTYVYISTITLDFDGNGFVFRGFTTEKFSKSRSKSSGQRIYKDSVKISGHGDGTVFGKPLVVTGLVSMRGQSVQ